MIILIVCKYINVILIISNLTVYLYFFIQLKIVIIIYL